MALEKSHNDPDGSTHSSAYHKIEYINIDYKTQSAGIGINIYKDSAARSDNKEAAESIQYGVSLSGIFDTTAQDVLDENPRSAAYDYLKTLPAYSGSIDV